MLEVGLDRQVMLHGAIVNSHHPDPVLTDTGCFCSGYSASGRHNIVYYSTSQTVSMMFLLAISARALVTS